MFCFAHVRISLSGCPTTPVRSSHGRERAAAREAAAAAAQERLASQADSEVVSKDDSFFPFS